MVLDAFLVAVLRYGFSFGAVSMQESYVWMNGVLFMAASGYALKHDAHVRVDVFYGPAGPRTKAVVDLLGTLFLLLPMVGAVFWFALPYVWASVGRLEASREAGGLPALYLLKGMILVFCLLTGLQGVALALRSYLRLRDAR
ncbi:MAG: TRAP transporter small permease subunit [Geminicoccaceae bacterium]|nr:TRAP transporter small permease subunit [Geminicoccaceae bacterium]